LPSSSGRTHCPSSSNLRPLTAKICVRQVKSIQICHAPRSSSLTKNLKSQCPRGGGGGGGKFIRIQRYSIILVRIPYKSHYMEYFSRFVPQGGKATSSANAGPATNSQKSMTQHIYYIKLTKYRGLLRIEASRCRCTPALEAHQGTREIKK